ncbi:MAG: hypothetical protein R6X16_07960 [Anaerolineae bacterium]
MPEHKGWYTRGYLPHRDEPGLVQAITFHLADSLPLALLRDGLPPADEIGLSVPTFSAAWTRVGGPVSWLIPSPLRSLRTRCSSVTVAVMCCSLGSPCRTTCMC